MCRPATVPTATGFDLPIIPEPQEAPTIVSLAPDDPLGSPLIPAPDDPSPSPAPRNVSFLARYKDKKLYTSQDVYGPWNDVPQSPQNASMNFTPITPSGGLIPWPFDDSSNFGRAPLSRCK